MDNETVVYDGTFNGERVQITMAEVLANDTVAHRVIESGIKRITDTAAQAVDEDDKPAAKLARAHAIKAGEPWPTGGGNRLSDADRARRDILAAYAATHLGLTHSKAEQRVRDDADKLASETAHAIIKRKDGKTPSKDRLAAGIEKFWRQVESEVSKRLQETASLDI